MDSSPVRVGRDLDRHRRDLLFAAIAARQHLQRNRCARRAGRTSSSQTRSIVALRGVSVVVDGDVEAIDRDRLDVVRQEHRQRAGHGRRSAQHRAVAGEHIVHGEVAVSLDVRAALHAEGGGAELAFVCAQRVEHRDVGKERREELIVDELIVQRAA